MKIKGKVAFALVAVLFLTSCSSPSKALEPLSQFCSGIKYLWDRAVKLDDGTQVRALLMPVIESAMALDPNSTEALEMFDNQNQYWKWIKDSDFEVKRVLANIASISAGNGEIYDYLDLKAKRDALGMTEPRTAIKESCAEVEKIVSEAGLEIAKDTVLQDGLDSYIKSAKK